MTGYFLSVSRSFIHLQISVPIAWMCILRSNLSYRSISKALVEVWIDDIRRCSCIPCSYITYSKKKIYKIEETNFLAVKAMFTFFFFFLFLFRSFFHNFPSTDVRLSTQWLIKKNWTKNTGKNEQIRFTNSQSTVAEGLGAVKSGKNVGQILTGREGMHVHEWKTSYST